jgi:hypothetical protein
MIEQRSRETTEIVRLLARFFRGRVEKDVRESDTGCCWLIWRYSGQLRVSRNSFGLNAPYCSQASTVDDRSQHERSIETYSEMPTAEKLFSIAFSFAASWSGGTVRKRLRALLMTARRLSLNCEVRESCCVNAM